MEAIGQLTSGIAHDFNNILTVINGNLDIQEMHLEDEGVDASYLDSALEASPKQLILQRKCCRSGIANRYRLRW